MWPAQAQTMASGLGKIVRIGDDELDPLPARIVSFDSSTGIITLEVLFAAAQAAVA